MSDGDMIEVLQQGLQDEMNSAFQYIALAGRYGDPEQKQDFLRYAADELTHAQKLMQLLQDMQAEIGEIPIRLEEQDDLYLFLIEYMAKEEAAVFYYEALENLLQLPDVQRMCREIRGEEQLHLRQIRELYQHIKEGGVHDQKQ